MESIINLIVDNSKVILISIASFWVLSALILAVFMRNWIKNAPLMPDDFDVEQNIWK